MLNAVRTTFLLAAMTGLLMMIGFLVGGVRGTILALGVAAIMNAISYWNADKLVLRLQNAVAVDRRRAPDLFAIVETLSERAGIPMPKLYVIETEQPNAFATGRNPENAAVAVSTGLLRHLDREEVAAVVAHELAHIRSRDTLTMTLTATLAGAVSMLAQFGLFFGGRNSNSPVGPIGTIVAVIVAPLAAAMVQMAVSRTREYEADRDGAIIHGNPLALASALEKISKLAKNFENPWARRAPAMAHLFIINPLAGPPARRSDNLFATHPDVSNRIAALHELAREMGEGDRPAPRPRPARARRPRSSSPGSGGWRAPDTRNRPDEGFGPRGPWG